MKHTIKSNKEYHKTMLDIYHPMDKGEAHLTATELKKLAMRSVAVETYEDEVLGLQLKKEPQSIIEIVELKIFEQKMTQAKLAEELGLSKSKVSEILPGKRKPDVLFLKASIKFFILIPNFC